MGDRYILTVLCPKCDAKHLDVYYAPTCDFTTFTCPGCDTVIDLAEYTGISAEDASNADEVSNIPIKVLMETLEQGALYLEAGGAHMAVERIRLLARALYRRPDICEMAQVEMGRILVEDIRAQQQALVSEVDNEQT